MYSNNPYDPAKEDYRGKYIELLDHGLVRLVDYMGSDLSIVRSARVSYDADWRPIENDDVGGISKDEKLIRYLMKNHHTSPFEMVDFIFEVKAPIFVLRQWHRHRTWSYNEVSARYTQLPSEYYIPDPTIMGVQSAHNKQMRDVREGLSPGELEAAEAQANNMQAEMKSAYVAYEILLAQGVARELARSVLPLGVYSRMFAKCDLHNLMHFLRLRLHPHAQYEIRVYAEAMLDLIEPIVPIATKYFRESLLGL